MQLLTIDDVAAQTKLSRTAIYRLVKRGELPVIRFGQAVRFPADALETYLESKVVVANVRQFGRKESVG